VIHQTPEWAQFVVEFAPNIMAGGSVVLAVLTFARNYPAITEAHIDVLVETLYDSIEFPDRESEDSK